MMGKHPLESPSQRIFRGCAIREEPWVWDKLGRPDCEPQKHPLEFPVSVSTVLSVTQSSGLLALPRELLDKIRAYLGLQSTLALALTCSAMLYEIRTVMEVQVRGEWGSWSGQPLACLGSWLTSLPPHFVADNLAGRAVGLDPNYQGTSAGWMFAREFHGRAIGLFEGPAQFCEYEMDDEPVGGMYQRQRWLRVLEGVLSVSDSRSTPQSERVHTKLVRYLRDIILGVRTDRQSVDSILTLPTSLERKRDGDQVRDRNVWYLRNLDRNEYIRLVQREEDSPPPPLGYTTLSAAAVKSSTDSRAEGQSSKLRPRIPHIVYVADYKHGDRPSSNQKKKEQRNMAWNTARNMAKNIARNDLSAVWPPPPFSKQKLAICQTMADPYHIRIEIIMSIRAWWPDSTGFMGPDSKTMYDMRKTSWAGHRFDMISHQQWIHEDEVDDCERHNNIPEESQRAKGSEAKEDGVHQEQESTSNKQLNTRARTRAQTKAIADAAASAAKGNSKAQWTDVTDETVEMMLEIVWKWFLLRSSY